MTRITFITHQGAAHTVEAKAAQSLMEAAVKNAVPGIDADCGGACACATCHVYVEPEWLEKVGERTEMERSMLEFAAEVETNSRLACQIRLDSALDGLTVRLPAGQH